MEFIIRHCQDQRYLWNAIQTTWYTYAQSCIWWGKAPNPHLSPSLPPSLPFPLPLPPLPLPLSPSPLLLPFFVKHFTYPSNPLVNIWLYSMKPMIMKVVFAPPNLFSIRTCSPIYYMPSGTYTHTHTHTQSAYMHTHFSMVVVVVVVACCCCYCLRWIGSTVSSSPFQMTSRASWKEMEEFWMCHKLSSLSKYE